MRISDWSSDVCSSDLSFQPSPADEEGAFDRFAQYTLALERRDFAAAYAMLRLSFQASNPRLEWEMNQRKRETLWADGQIRPLRLSWYLDPAGQPAGLYRSEERRVGNECSVRVDLGGRRILKKKTQMK